MRAAAAAEEFEQATLERNRLRAVHSLLERRRVANESVGTLDAVAVAVDGREANAQVFQVRDGVLSDRQSFYLSNETERDVAEVAEEFMLQFYAAHISIPPLLIVQRELVEGAVDGARRGARASGAAGRSSCARPSAARSAGSSSWPSATRAWRSTRSACAPSAVARAAWRRSRGCSSRWDSTCRRSGSSASTSRTSAARRRSPRWSCSRAARRRSPTTGASRSGRWRRAPPTTSRRWRRCSAGASPNGSARPTSPRTTRQYNASFAALPNLVVIDGGKGQLAAGLGPLRGFRERGVAVVSLAKRIEEVFIPGRAAPLVLDHSTPELQLLQRVRDEAHRFAITHHRTRRDRAMTSSLLDELPGVGPARKRALLAHFGSPEAVVAASREELQAVPGLPAKVARELHGHLHRAG